jgi:hypothetical protein
LPTTRMVAVTKRHRRYQPLPFIRPFSFHRIRRKTYIKIKQVSDSLICFTPAWLWLLKSYIVRTIAYFSQVRSLRTTHLSKEILESLLFVLREKKFLLIPLQAPLAKVHCTPNVCCSHKSIATIFLPPNDHRHT